MSIDNPDNPKYGTTGGNSTNDQCFLLSYEEALEYFPDEASRQTGTVKSKEKVSWILRTKGETSYEAMVVNADGTLNYEGEDIFMLTPKSGIRPAVWLNIGEVELYGDDAQFLKDGE